MSNNHPRIATLAAQAGHFVDPNNGAIVPPIHSSTTFARNSDYTLTQPGRSYARADNPTFEHVESLLCALEGGQEALIFASGMAAAAAFFASFGRGDRIIVQARAYYGVLRLAASLPQRTGVAVDFWTPAGNDPTDNNPTDLDSLEALLDSGAAAVWLETPANPTWDVIDIEAVAALAHRYGACVAVDSTCATPVLTRPLDFGADYVMHSATKYLNGHSDVIAGALVARDADQRFDRVRQHRAESGAIIGAFEAWLLFRGMRTLVPRVRMASANALSIAHRLGRHPAVERVLYPGLPSHPGHDVALKQMTGGFGGMLSVLVKGGREAALAVAGHLALFVRATSLGGVESLVEHRASIEPEGNQVPPNLLRLSVGIEDSDDLIADLTQALDRVAP